MANRSDIAMYLKCIWCQRDGIEPRIEAGFTTDGNLQLWCAVHDAAIGPPMELRFPPLVAHLTCSECRDAQKRTHEHDGKGHSHSEKQVSEHASGHDHDHQQDH